MSPGPSRRFGGQSRVAISTITKKYTVAEPDSASRFLFGEESFGQSDPDDATRPLTPLDLRLAPFKMEEETQPAGDEESDNELGCLAWQTVDEDALGDVEGMPSRAQWKSIVDTYLASLHPTKRHKSLITQEFYKMIFRTLKAPEATRLGTPQFRFWARKMFQLVEAPNNVLVVTNGGRPVAIKEHIYDILCMCHLECGHGGRDKTCKILREYYTWVPKELISNFVKVCPTCAPRKVAHSKAKDHKAELTLSRLKEESPPPPPRFHVERLKDFGQLPSPLSDEFRQLKLPSVNLHSPASAPQHGYFETPSGLTGPCFLKFHSNASLPPWSGNSHVTLPPLNASTENDDSSVNNDMFETNRRLPLPPLMQYLSQSQTYENNGKPEQSAEDGPNPAPQVPIDPALLDVPDRSGSSCTSCTSPHCSGCEVASAEQSGNTLHLQLHGLTAQDQHDQLTGNSSLDRSANTIVWEFPSVASTYGGEGDNSALLSASTVSIGLPTPSASGQISPAESGYAGPFQYYTSEIQSLTSFDGITRDGQLATHSCVLDTKMALELPRVDTPQLLSPQPIKVENANAVFELTAAASMHGTDD